MMDIKKKVLNKLRTDTVMVIAGVLAVASCVVVPPDAAYVDYIDVRTLCVLLCLMLVVAGFTKLGVFAGIGHALLGRIQTERGLILVLVSLCFMTSMLVTNDVALITFVPLGILILKMASLSQHVLTCITLMTIAANLGSMITPIGNPQNLYLYSQSGMSLGQFFQITTPYTLMAAGLLIVAIFVLFRKKPVACANQETAQSSYGPAWYLLYLAQFILCLLTVIKLIPFWVVLIVILITTSVTDWHLLGKADYGLLLTFVFFFVFIGNMGRMEAFHDFVGNVLEGREIAVSAGISQVISNVPTAILLSGFSHQWKELIIGVNLGGLGTLIASMASLISYKQIAVHFPERKRTYLGIFTVMNLVFLVLMCGVCLLIRGSGR